MGSVVMDECVCHGGAVSGGAASRFEAGRMSGGFSAESNLAASGGFGRGEAVTLEQLHYLDEKTDEDASSSSLFLRSCVSPSARF